MKPVIYVSGRAKQVFKYVELLGRHGSKTTLKELAKDNKTLKAHLS